MNELNWKLRHRRFVIFGSILYIICSLFACDDKVAEPPRLPQEKTIPVTSEQKKADTNETHPLSSNSHAAVTTSPVTKKTNPPQKSSKYPNDSYK